MPKHCINWHFLKFLNQIWLKMTVIVTLHVVAGLRALIRFRHLLVVLGVLLLRMFWVKKIEKVPKVTLYAYLFKPNPPNNAK